MDDSHEHLILREQLLLAIVDFLADNSVNTP